MKRVLETDVLVIGAGPAGLAAATEAAAAGASVQVIDGFAQAGGQYWMQAPAGAPAADPQMREGAARIADLHRAGITVHTGTEVWGASPDRRVWARGPDGEALEIGCRALVVCSGAHDKVAPFPGWTLPGVMTAGGGQRFAKQSGKAPGRKVVVAGSGIFLWAVAASVARAGGEVVAMVEAHRNRARLAWLMARHPDKWRDALRLARPVLKQRPRMISGQVVTRVLGEDRVTAVRVGQAGGGASETEIETDCLLVGHGFRPLTELTALLRCAHAFDPARGGWYCRADPLTGATSVPGIFAAGEVTGFAGARPASLGGALAGIAAAKHCGHSAGEASARSARIARQLARARLFAERLSKVYPPVTGLSALLTPDTCMCRCEDVTWGDVTSAWKDGATEIGALKYWTRAGMGRCQGRICGSALADALSETRSVRREDLGVNPARLPLRPVGLDVVAAAFSPAEACPGGAQGSPHDTADGAARDASGQAEGP